jgi:hypothetical protein
LTRSSFTVVEVEGDFVVDRTVDESTGVDFVELGEPEVEEEVEDGAIVVVELDEGIAVVLELELVAFTPKVALNSSVELTIAL